MIQYITLTLMCLIAIWAYHKGLETGLSINKNQSVPQLIRTPKVVQDFIHRKESKEIEDFNTAFNNIMSYSGEPQKGSEKQ